MICIGGEMTRFVQSEVRRQGILLPEYLDDYVAEGNPVRVIDVFVDELDLWAVGFDGVIPEATGRPAQQVHRNPTIGNRQPANHPPITHLRFYTASIISRNSN
jgi:hypothetical protein